MYYEDGYGGFDFPPLPISETKSLLLPQKENCVFCNLDKDEIIVETEYFVLKFDKYPVTDGHILIISKNHKDNYFNLSDKEQGDLLHAIHIAKSILMSNCKPDGFNIGMNCGKVAGQTVMHFHCHVIPRYIGDIDDPTGGVRGVIPEKRIY